MARPKTCLLVLFAIVAGCNGGDRSPSCCHQIMHHASPISHSAGRALLQAAQASASAVALANSLGSGNAQASAQVGQTRTASRLIIKSRLNRHLPPLPLATPTQLLKPWLLHLQKVAQRQPPPHKQRRSHSRRAARPRPLPGHRPLHPSSARGTPRLPPTPWPLLKTPPPSQSRTQPPQPLLKRPPRPSPMATRVLPPPPSLPRTTRVAPTPWLSHAHWQRPPPRTVAPWHGPLPKPPPSPMPTDGARRLRCQLQRALLPIPCCSALHRAALRQPLPLYVEGVCGTRHIPRDTVFDVAPFFSISRRPTRCRRVVRPAKQTLLPRQSRKAATPLRWHRHRHSLLDRVCVQVGFQRRRCFPSVCCCCVLFFPS